jgi:hypothetical protein
MLVRSARHAVGDTVQFARKLTNAQIRALVGSMSRGGSFKVFNGAAPPDCEAEDPPGLLAVIELPKRALHEVDGAVELTEAWTTHGNDESGRGKLARSFRLCDYDNDTLIQGSVSAKEEGGDLLLDNPSIAAGQKFAITKFRIEMWLE